ncbi:MAG: hypothetical protein ABSF44_12570 [Candidatus Bathyarchaeia archaeon]|jgi:hypothetical protein
MMTESEYSVHFDFDKIKAETEKLQGASKETIDKIDLFLDSLKETTARVEPTLSKETNNERELWEDYKQLQREKLAVLDLSHEWDYVGEEIKQSNPRLDFLVRDAIEELNDHIGVLAESHRAHIDILEIYNTRKIEVLALVVTVVISYIAVWEFTVRDLLVSFVFPYGLSPRLNYVIVILTLLPVFVTVAWAWVRRKSYF